MVLWIYYSVCNNFNRGAFIMCLIEDAETKQHEKALAEAWDSLGWTDELAQIKAEEASLNFINVTYERSRLYEIEQCANEGYHHG